MISALFSGLLAVIISVLYNHFSKVRELRVQTTIKVVEECDRLHRAYYEFKGSKSEGLKEESFNRFQNIYNEFGCDVMIELAYGKGKTLKRYRRFRIELHEAMMAIHDSGNITGTSNRNTINIENEINELRKQLFNSLITKKSCISSMKNEAKALLARFKKNGNFS